MNISIIEDRQSGDCFIFIMGISILTRLYLHIEIWCKFNKWNTEITLTISQSDISITGTVGPNDHPWVPITMFAEHAKETWACFLSLLKVSSDYAQPITGQVTEVTWPVIGWAWSEFTQSKRQKMGPAWYSLLMVKHRKVQEHQHTQWWLSKVDINIYKTSTQTINIMIRYTPAAGWFQECKWRSKRWLDIHLKTDSNGHHIIKTQTKLYKRDYVYFIKCHILIIYNHK